MPFSVALLTTPKLWIPLQMPLVGCRTGISLLLTFCHVGPLMVRLRSLQGTTMSDPVPVSKNILQLHCMPSLTMWLFFHVKIYFFVIYKVSSSLYGDCMLNFGIRHVRQGWYYVLDWPTITFVRYYIFIVPILMTWQFQAVPFEACVLGWWPSSDWILYGTPSQRLSKKCDLQCSSTKNHWVWRQRQRTKSN